MSAKILRLKHVIDKTGLARSTIYARMADDTFPKSLALGGRVRGWLEQDIENWIEERVAESKRKSLGAKS